MTDFLDVARLARAIAAAFMQPLDGVTLELMDGSDAVIAMRVAAAYGSVSRKRLRANERFAAERILDRPNADPGDDAAIVARAVLRLAALDSEVPA